MPRVLIVDDEEPLRASLSYALTREGYSVATAVDGATALERARASEPDVVILDVMLPGLDGVEVCRRLRASSDVPVVLLTAKDHTADKVSGLSSGADDYVTKPFDTPELVARVGAVLRRRSSAQRLLAEDRALLSRMEEMLRHVPIPRLREAHDGDGGTHGTLSLGPVAIDLDTQAVSAHGKPVVVSAPEYAILRLLMSYAGRVVTRTELIERIWGNSTGEEGYTLLAVHIRTLREKLEPDPANPRYIVSVPGIGFRFDVPEPAE